MSKYQSTQITYNNVGGIPTPCDSKSGYGLQNNQYDAVVDELTYRPIKNPLVQANSAATMSVINAINTFLQHTTDYARQHPDLPRDIYVNAYHWITKCVNDALNFELDRMNERICALDSHCRENKRYYE